MTNPNTLDAVELARKVVATGNIHDSGPRIDVIARALLALSARCQQLEEGLRSVLDALDDEDTFVSARVLPVATTDRLRKLLEAKMSDAPKSCKTCRHWDAG